MSLPNITDSEFESTVLTSSDYNLVDFWAPWCGPCKALAPVLEDLQEQTSVKILKINVDDNPLTPTKYGIRSIPTLILFKNGEVVTQRVGGATLSDLKDWLENEAK